MSDIHEKETLAVSEKTAQEETLVVKEAFGFDGMPPAAAPAMDAMDYADAPQYEEGSQYEGPAHEEERQEAQGPRAWLQSQKACDFVPFLMHEFDRIGPGARARGKSEAERAMGQFKRLNHHISKALQSDYDGEIDIKKVEPVRQQIESTIEQLQATLDALSDLEKKRKQMRRPNRRRGSEEICGDCGSPLWKQGDAEPSCLLCESMVKEATTPRYQGLQYQISGFERAIIGTLINGKVSGGRSIEDLYAKLKKKYGITEREELAIIQAMADMGYPEFLDRAKIGEEVDPTDEKNVGEWQAQYFA